MAKRNSGVTARRRASAALCRILPALGGRPFLRTIFTIPEELRQVVVDHVAWESWMRALKRQLRRHWDLDWAMVTYHPCGDEEGLEIFKPHVEVHWVAVPGSNLARRGKLPAEDLPVLRRMWARIIGWDGEVNLHHSFILPDRRGRYPDRKLWHVVAYALRPFPGWSYWRGHSVRWWGNRPPAVSEVCQGCGHEYTDKEDRFSCPDCGRMIGAVCEHCGEPIIVVDADDWDRKPRREEPKREVPSAARSPP